MVTCDQWSYVTPNVLSDGLHACPKTREKESADF